MNNVSNVDNTDSISNLLRSIEKGEIVLPEFQRDFVWEMPKTYDLFDSLVRNIFIGALIYGKPSSEITVRELDNRPRKAKGSRRGKLKIYNYSEKDIREKSVSNFRLLLDGQQRVTSIYRALKGIDSIWFIVKKPEEKRSNENSLENWLYEFDSKESQERLSIKISDVYAIMEGVSGAYREKRIREEFFDKLSFITTIDSPEDKDRFFDIFLDIKEKIQDLFKSEKLLSYYLLDTSDEKFALFFERSNSRSVNLNFIDILAAKLYCGFNLRDKIESFRGENSDSSIELNREIIVRAISYIASEGRSVEKSYILSKLTHHHFIQNWDDVCALYKKCISFLKTNNFIIDQSWMPYENMLIPMMFFLKRIGGDFSQATEKHMMFIHSWYWAAVFSQRYAGSTNDTIVQDAKILETIAESKKIQDRTYLTRLFKIQIESYDELYAYSKSASAIYSGVLNLVTYKSKGTKDWRNSNKVDSSNMKLEEHHIFPREYLKSKYSGKGDDVLEYVDSVVNKAIVPKLTNIKFRDKPPSIYLQEIVKDNRNLHDTLKCHLIDSALLEGKYDEDYPEFLKVRAQEIFKLIKDIADKKDSIIADFYGEDNSVI